MNNHSPSQPYFSSLEENLTNSIRRAKEKIYHHSLTTYPLSNDFSQESDKAHQTIYHQYPQTRNRTASQRVSSHSATGKEESSALAAAMKNLQERIATLQREKRQMSLKKQSSEESMQRIDSGEREQIEKDMTRLVTALRDKQQEVKRLNRVNSDLSSKNTDLLERILELEQELERSRKTSKNLDIKHSSKQEPKIQTPSLIQPHQECILDGKIKSIAQKDLRIAELEDQLKQWESRNALSHQTIEKLMRQLEEEKKTNLRWIKLHEEQLKKEPQKQNNSLDANRTDIKAKIRQPERRDYGQLLRANKQMHDALQKNKIKINDLAREVKQSEQRYAKLKLLVFEIVDNVNKIMPHPNAHLRFLTNRIEKLDNVHLQSLRSISNHSRRSVPRNSHSNQRKKSLKMSDLNSSSKKSHERSAGKSSRKRKPIQQLSHSEKKPRLISDQELELQRLEREVAGLRRQHRNLVVRAEKNGNGDTELNTKIEETTLLYVEKKNRLEQLRRSGCQGIAKKQPLVLE